MGQGGHEVGEKQISFKLRVGLSLQVVNFWLV